MHKIKPLRFLCVSLLLILLALGHQSVSAQSGLVLSNLDNTTTGVATFDPQRYQSFLVGSSNATIYQFLVEFGNANPGPGIDPGTVGLSLYSDNASAPGSSLADFSYGGSPFALSNNTITFGGNFDVMANTRYWIGIIRRGWWYDAEVRTTSDSSETGFAGWSIDDSSLLQYGDSGPSIKMAIWATAVPEPSALSLLAIGLGGLAMMRRRRS